MFDNDSDIEKHIREMNAALVFFDPLQGHTGKSVDLSRATDIRRIMTNLAVIAERNDCAVIVIAHPNKNLGTKDLYRVLGSVDITAARSVLLAEREGPMERNWEICSKREGVILGKLREVIVTFEAESYPDKQLSYDFLARLVGSTRSELQLKAEVNTELQAFLCEIVEHRSVWREERTAKISDCCSRREKQIRKAIEQILSNPPHEQISRNYIAKVAGLSSDILKEDSHLSEITNNIVESKLDWLKRRLTLAYHAKPVEGRPYSTLKICRAASIDWMTYNKHRELFDDMVNNFNAETK